MTDPKTIHIQYYALLREKRGCSAESIQTEAATALVLYQQLRDQYHFHLDTEQLRVVINEAFCDWETPLQDEDTVVFIPPVAGG